MESGSWGGGVKVLFGTEGQLRIALFQKATHLPPPFSLLSAPSQPTRVSTAVSCQFLSQVSGELKHFAHLQTICEELFSFIYKDFKNTEDSNSLESGEPGARGERNLRGFMHGMPFFELARSLRVHVTRLEEERKELEAEEAQLVVRRQVRKRVVRRLITERQRQLMQVFFGQWRTTVEKVRLKA